MNILHDIRHGARTLWKDRAVTATAVFVLGIGIGVNATVLSWHNAVLLRPFPGVAAQEHLVVVAEQDRNSVPQTLSYPNYLDFAKRARSLTGVVVWDNRNMSYGAGERVERVYGSLVSGNYFDLLGVRMVEGRGFRAEEDATPGTHPVAVVSYEFRQRHLSDSTAVIGTTILLNNLRYTIVGIADPAFQGTMVGLAVDVWIPLAMEAQALGSDRRQQRGARGLLSLGRLAPAATFTQARTELQTVGRALAHDYPETNAGRSATILRVGDSPWGAQSILRPVLRTLSLLGIFVLLLTCANVANLMLSRAIARRRDLAIRATLGATRWRLFQQLLTESTLLALLGGAVALVVTNWSARLLLVFLPPTSLPVRLPTEIDFRLFWSTLSVSLVTGLIFGIIPALQQASAARALATLREEGTRSGGGGRRRQYLSGVLVVAQVALSLVLLVVAGLFIRGLAQARTINPGFDPRHLLVTTYDLASGNYDGRQGPVFHERLIAQVEALPGVDGATLFRRLPLSFVRPTGALIAIEGYQPAPNEDMNVGYATVGPRFLQVMRMPLLAGRDIASTDREGTATVAIVNETMARRFWPDRNPIGQYLTMANRRLQVVGVAGNGKYESLSEEPRAFFYVPLWQTYRSDVALVVRTAGDPRAMLPTIARTIRALDARLPVIENRTMTEHLETSLFTGRLAAMLIGALGGLALLLASVGLYAVIAYSVSLQTVELGVRMAFGAQAPVILGMVVRRGLRLSVVGVVLGAAMAFALTQILSNQLHGVNARDPLVFLGVASLVLIAGAAACVVPAWRAIRVDPIVALRHE